MPELTHKERLQPSLLDRLTDDEPHSNVESREQRVLSSAQLQESVVRDLAWLFNSVNFSCCQDMGNCTLAQRSVINYGIPSLSGAIASGLSPKLLAEQLTTAIRDFEPRLIADTVRVSAEVSAHDMSASALTFRIEAVLWAQPLPIELYMQAEVDLDTGGFEVTIQD